MGGDLPTRLNNDRCPAYGLWRATKPNGDDWDELTPYSWQGGYVNVITKGGRPTLMTYEEFWDLGMRPVGEVER